MRGWEVRPRARRTAKQRLAKALSMLVLLLIPFVGGAWWQASQMNAPYALLPTNEAVTAELEQRMLVLASASDVARQADEHNRQTIKSLEEQIFKLQQELAFYKGVIAPGTRREGLRVRSLDLQSTAEPRVYRYNIMLSRVGADNEVLSGELHVTVKGKVDGKPAQLELEQLSDESAGPIAFEFKHFQAIPATGRFAEMHLPEGFEPEQIEVRAEVKGQEPLKRTFNWIEIE